MLISEIPKIFSPKKEEEVRLATRLVGRWPAVWNMLLKFTGAKNASDLIRMLIQLGATVFSHDDSGKPVRVRLHYTDSHGVEHEEDILKFLNWDTKKVGKKVATK